MSCSRIEISEEKKIELQNSEKAFSAFIQSGALNNKKIRHFHMDTIHLQDVNLENVKFEDVCFFRSMFENVTFSNGEYELLEMDGSTFKNVIFKNVNIKNTNFSSSHNKKDTVFENVVFDGCTLDNIEMNNLSDSYITFRNSNINEFYMSGGKIKLVIENTNLTDSYFNAEFLDNLVINGGETVQLRLKKSKMNNLIINNVKNLHVGFCANDVHQAFINADTGCVSIGGNINFTNIVFNKKGHVSLGAGLKQVKVYYPKDVTDSSLSLRNSIITSLELYNFNAHDVGMIDSEIRSLSIYDSVVQEVRFRQSTIGILTLHDVHFNNSIKIDDLKIGTLHIINGSKKNKNKEDSAYGAIVQTLICEKTGKSVWTRENIEGQHILDAL